MRLHHRYFEAMQEQGIDQFTKQACADCKPGDNGMMAKTRQIQGVVLNTITLQQNKSTSLDDVPSTD